MKRALFVGVDEYDDPQIRNLRISRIDAHSLNDLFADIGYDVKYLPNPTKAEVLAAVRERTAGLAAGDSFIFYFAGHGFTQGGHDLLFCRDDVYEDLRFDDAGLKFEKLRQRTETGSGYDRVFVLDACRSDFLTGTRGTATYARDLAPVKNLVKDVTPKTGSLAVLRSCCPYQYALEIESRQHGLFTCALIDVMRAARREGARLAFDESFGDAVAKTMTDIARNAHLTAEQTPDFAKSAGCAAQVLIEGVARQPRPAASPVYVACPECGKYNLPTDTFRCTVCGRDHLCLKHFSEAQNSCMSCAAKQEHEIIEKTTRQIASTGKRRAKPSAPSVVTTSRDPSPGEEMTITLPGGVLMTFCWCPATTSEAWKKITGGDDFYWMGSPESEPKRVSDETRHRVTLTKGFWMGKYEVTQRQWEGVMESNPSKFKSPDRPVEQISWDDCQAFIRQVNVAVRTTVSLPIEAQWEYACRAGTTTPFNFGSSLNGDNANCDGNYPYGATDKGRYRGKIAPVGSYAPNAWGLYDMHGNVWEWCQDWYGHYSGDATDPTGPASGSFRVQRGGGWINSASCCRSASRCNDSPSFGDGNLGFRLCCSAGPRR